jgi:transposase InsO family protein
MAPKVVMTMADWRLEVLLQAERREHTVTQICVQHEISRDTFYRWKRRLATAGIQGLLDRQRIPIHQPRRIPVELENLICSLRRSHPRWGARTIRTRMARKGIPAPSVSTIHRVLRRNFLVTPNPMKKPRALLRRFERDEPNDLWQMDAKPVVLNDGTEAYVVCVLDDHARFMLSGVVCRGPTCEINWEAFERAARAYGLPRQVLTDNHLTFTGRLYGKEVIFERRLKAIRVQLINGRPSHPQTQGKVERFHRTLQEFLDDAGGADDFDHLQSLVDAFRGDYNNDRPHQAIGDATPAERYRPSDMLFDQVVLNQPAYPADAIVRKVDTGGMVMFEYLRIALGTEWTGKRVRIVPVADDLQIFYGDYLIRALTPDRSRRRQPWIKRRSG